MSLPWIAVEENRAARRGLLRHIMAIKKGSFVPLLVIRGKPGSGKTRLAEEGLTRLMKTVPGATWRMLGPKDLLGTLKSPHSEHYEGRELLVVDWLILDDFGPMAETMEERLCRILDHRQAHSRPTLIFSAQPALKLAETTRLQGRLRGGISVELGPWREKSRLIWLRRLVLQGHILVSRADLPVLAKKLPTLPGSMASMCQTMGRLPTRMPQATYLTAPTPETILEAVVKEFGISLRQIRGKSRTRKINEARQAAMYLLRTILEMSLEAIGFTLGGRDHKTIHSGLARVKLRKRTDKTFSNLLKSSQSLIL